VAGKLVSTEKSTIAESLIESCDCITCMNAWKAKNIKKSTVPSYFQKILQKKESFSNVCRIPRSHQTPGIFELNVGAGLALLADLFCVAGLKLGQVLRQHRVLQDHSVHLVQRKRLCEG